MHKSKILQQKSGKAKGLFLFRTQSSSDVERYHHASITNNYPTVPGFKELGSTN